MCVCGYVRRSPASTPPHHSMLRKEEVYRLSPYYQALFGEDGGANIPQVIDDLQHRVGIECGVPPLIAAEAMRCAEVLLDGDPEVVQISHYRRYNRMRDGHLQVVSSCTGGRLPLCAGVLGHALSQLALARQSIPWPRSAIPPCTLSPISGVGLCSLVTLAIL